MRLLSPDPVEEGDAGETREIVIPIGLNFPAPAAVTARYEVRPADPATVVDDFAESAGTIAFAPGQERAEVRLQVIGDDTPEPDEQFALVITEIGGATVDGDYGESSSVPLPWQERFNLSVDCGYLVVGLKDDSAAPFVFTDLFVHQGDDSNRMPVFLSGTSAIVERFGLITIFDRNKGGFGRWGKVMDIEGSRYYAIGGGTQPLRSARRIRR